MPKHKVQVRYFASLREKAGRTEESVETSATTAGDLYAELKAKYNFPLEEKHLKMSLNRSYRSFDTALNEGDEVVFIPPVSGG